jgi:dTDP-4-dehydrorhamnose reductase
MELQDLAPVFPGYKFIFKSREELPIEQPGSVERIFKDLAPAYCINTAAYTQVDRAEEPGEREHVFAVNGHAVAGLARVCSHYGTKLVHLSTDYVFNGSGHTPYRETDETGPLNVYGESKLLGEQSALSQTDAIVIRTSWVYSSYGKNFVKAMLKLMKEKKEISVVNDQLGSPTYAADLGEAILQIISASAWHPGLYHYSNAGIISWYEFAVAIRDIIKSACRISPIPATAYPTKARRPAWSVLDNSRIREVYGIRQKDWKASLEKCISRIQRP